MASRAFVYEHRFHGFSILTSLSSHAHTSELRSSLGPEHILATSAGLVRVKLCVDSFMIIHMCSSLRLCINFQNLAISLARSMVFGSSLVASL